MKQHVILIGFKSCGKTSLGRLLSWHLNLPFIDTDEQLLKSTDSCSISALYTHLGESRFRRLENQIVLNLNLNHPCVIATGGGMVLNQQAMGYLSSVGKIVFLNTDLEVLIQRLSKQDNSLFEHQHIESVYQQRQPLYQHYANVDYAIKDESCDEICDHILQYLEVIDG